MFHYDGGLKITALDLAIDFRRRQPRGFISHAHNDHLARHELAFCTPATAAIYQHRLGPQRVREMAYRQPLEWGGLRITVFPAGHMLGSAMLLVEGDEGSLLYTGDYKLGESATAERAELPRADVLVMESTFGDPAYRLPPRSETIARLVEIVQQTLADGKTPVIRAYVVGKAQEVTAILTSAGIPVVQHPLIYAASQVYEACGCSLGDVACYSRSPPPGAAVIVPPIQQKAEKLTGIAQPITISVTGWAQSPRSRGAWRTDHALPLSDHADFDELLATIDQVQPRVIYCTHGPASFIDILLSRGLDARPLTSARGMVAPK